MITTSMRVIGMGAVLMLVGAGLSLHGQALPWRSAQDLPAFEAASVKVDVTAETPFGRTRFQPGTFQASYVTARQLVKAAYSLTVDQQMVGGPDWMDSARFDIQAKTLETNTAQMRLMLQRLLIERFRLAARSEKAELPVFALTMARDDGRLGARLKSLGDVCQPPSPQAAPGVDQLPCDQAPFGGGFLLARGISIARFAQILSGSSSYTGIDRLVVDRTSLHGLYAIDVRFTQPEAQGLRKQDTADVLPEFPTAIREQLGLKLEPTRAPVDAIVIERIERPTPN
jgi:uncharacterized protein (TIGR03435 family)